MSSSENILSPHEGMQKPFVSVLVASYNYEQYLGATLQSLCDQTWKDFEVLVIDDGSTDKSVPLAEAYAAQDARIHVVCHHDGKNHGLPATLKLGLARAQGEYIAFLESDDIWTPVCLERRIEALQHSKARAVFNGIEPMPMPGATTDWFDSYVPRIMKEHAERAGNAYSLQTALLVENKIPTFSCIMVASELLRQCSFKAPVPRWLDWWLWIQLAQETDFIFLAEKMTLWRIHNQSFNHKTAFTDYLADGSAIWSGFKKELRQKYVASGEKKASFFLLCPFWVRLFVRFCMIAHDCGFKETIKRIAGRLR